MTLIERNKLGSSERMGRVMKDLVKHTQRANKTTVQQTNCKIWN